MTRLLDDGHLGQLFGMALAAQAARPHARSTWRPARGLPRPRAGACRCSTMRPGRWRISAAQAKLGLITDGTHRVQARKVAALGIAPHFREIVYTHALGGRAFSKPHPQSYEMIEQALGAAGRPLRLCRRQSRPRTSSCRMRGAGPASWCIGPGTSASMPRAEVAAGGAPQHTIASLTELPALLGP